MSFLWNSISRFWDSLMQSLGLAGKKGNLILLGLDNSGKTTLLHRLQACGDESIGQAIFPPTDRPTQNSFSYQNITFTAWDLGGHEVVRHLWQDYVASASSTTNKSRSAPISAILFLIDASDSERLEEAAYELDHLIHETLLQENDDDSTCSAAVSMSIHDGHDDSENGDDDSENDYSAAHHSVNGNGRHAQETLAASRRNSRSNSNNIPPIAILLNKCDLESALSTEEICRRVEWDALQKSISTSRHYGDDTASSRFQVFRVSVLQGQGYPQAFQWISSFL
jgi:GTPase SAR1 family protein